MSLLPRDIAYKTFKHLDYLQILDRCEEYENLCNDENFWYDLAHTNYDITRQQFQGTKPIIDKFSTRQNPIIFAGTLAPYLKYLQLYLQLPIDEGNRGIIYPSVYSFIGGVIERKNLDFIKFVMDFVSKFSDKDLSPDNFIYYAGKTGKKSIVDYFLKLAKSTISEIKIQNYQWYLNRALEGAASIPDIGNLPLIDYLIELGAKADIFKSAATYDHTELLKEFYKRQHPDKEEIDEALELVNKDESILFLLSVGGDPHIALPKLAHNGNFKYVKQVLEDYKLRRKKTINDALDAAVAGGYLPIVKLLLPLTTLPKQKLFNTAASLNKNTEVLEYLYDSNIDLDESLLKASEYNDSPRIFNWLVSKGADNIPKAIELIVDRGIYLHELSILKILIREVVLNPEVGIEKLQDIFDNLDEDVWKLIPIFVEYGVNIDERVKLAVENDNNYLANILLIGLYKRYQTLGTLPRNINILLKKLKNISNLSGASKDILADLTQNKLI